MKQPLIILTGPTAVGKTKMSIALAKAVGGEIISADSMQVYREMDIGSAKIRPEEMDGIRHYLIDVLDPDEEFHVVRFQEMAKAAMAEIYGRNKIPILTGGTGFYIQAVVRDIAFGEENAGQTSYRQELERLAQDKDALWLHRQLEAVDPEAARQIHPNNRKRILRALEFYHDNQTPISAHNREQQAKTSPYACAYFVLTDDRARLYRRIDGRVDQMMADGLLEEVKQLKARGCTRDMVSMQGLGYRELLAFLDGEYSLEEAVEKIKQNTRHFAKRQLTWFKREKEKIWVSWEDFDYQEEPAAEYILKICRERGIYL